MTTSRLETFADGVFAIAATLLILDVHPGEGPLGEGLLHAWPSYAAYAVSFLTIGVIWVNHHAVLGQLAAVDRKFLFLNVLFLMLVAFIPFPTRLAAEHLRSDGAEAAALAYGITLTATAVLFNLLWLYASRRRQLLREDADPHVVSGITRSFLPGPVIYFAATLLALWSPTTSLIVFASVAVFYVFEKRWGWSAFRCFRTWITRTCRRTPWPTQKSGPPACRSFSASSAWARSSIAMTRSSAVRL